MTTTDLDCLDGKTIAVHIDVKGSQVLVKGVGAVYDDSSLGSCLRIAVDEAEGGFELILRQSEFSGEVHSGREYRCDYQIFLRNTCPTP